MARGSNFLAKAQRRKVITAITPVRFHIYDDRIIAVAKKKQTSFASWRLCERLSRRNFLGERLVTN